MEAFAEEQRAGDVGRTREQHIVGVVVLVELREEREGQGVLELGEEEALAAGGRHGDSARIDRCVPHDLLSNLGNALTTSLARQKFGPGCRAPSLGG